MSTDRKRKKRREKEIHELVASRNSSVGAFFISGGDHDLIPINLHLHHQRPRRATFFGRGAKISFCTQYCAPTNGTMSSSGNYLSSFDFAYLFCFLYRTAAGSALFLSSSASSFPIWGSSSSRFVPSSFPSPSMASLSASSRLMLSRCFCLFSLFIALLVLTSPAAGQQQLPQPQPQPQQQEGVLQPVNEINLIWWGTSAQRPSSLLSLPLPPRFSFLTFYFLFPSYLFSLIY